MYSIIKFCYLIVIWFYWVKKKTAPKSIQITEDSYFQGSFPILAIDPVSQLHLLVNYIFSS